MATDLQTLRSDPFREIGQLVESNAELLIERWSQRALQEQPNAEGAHRAEINDRLPSFLQALGRALTSSNASGPKPHCLLAIEHGEQRWKAGWRLAEVVRDYQLLRVVILENLELWLSRTLVLGEVISVGLFLDEAIEAAVITYVGFEEAEVRLAHNEAALAAEKLQAAHMEAERATQAKADFLANVSHELRTPMNAIIGMTELALGENLPSVVQDYLETTQSSAAVLLELLNEILDFSKLAAGKFVLEAAPFVVGDLLEEIMKTMSAAACEKGLDLVCDLPREVPICLVGDALRLRQSLVNLISNAIKFTDHGEVSVAIRVESQTAEEVELLFAVSDTGIGVSEEEQRRIFQPFTQVDSSVTRGNGGTGLGLAITSDLIRLMRGKIWIESAVGEGSTFYFSARFGRAAENNPPRATEGEHLKALRNVPVLVVDDSATCRRVISESLTELHMRPQIAADAVEALKLLEDAAAAGQAFPLAIIDALMPGMDGFALVEQIRTQNHLVSALVLMLAPPDRQIFGQRLRNANVSVVLEKPVFRQGLLVAVSKALGILPPDLPSDTPGREISAGIGRRLRVLLAEDVGANQKLMLTILRKRGHLVELAANGREAVDLIRKRNFDLVLMDVQMPIMDGFQATAAIRALGVERQARVPIVAMTAHAMQGDRERCLQAGMDAYVSKPIHTGKLLELIESLADGKESPGTEAPVVTNAPAVAKAPVVAESAVAEPGRPQTFQFDKALGRMGGNPALFRDLAQFFFEDGPVLLTQLRTSLASRDLATAERAAHSLKGLASNFDAAEVVRLALQIEHLTHVRDAPAAERLAPSLEHEVTLLNQSLALFLVSLS